MSSMICCSFLVVDNSLEHDLAAVVGHLQRRCMNFGVREDAGADAGGDGPAHKEGPTCRG